MSDKGRMIALKSGDGAEIGCYHVAAVGQRRGGLVVIQEIFGVNDHIKETCDRFAADGYEVLAPALFDRIEKNFDVGYTPADIARARDVRAKNPIEDAVMDTKMCIARLAAPVFMTGYCYGGTVCWAAACRLDGLAAVSGYYGAGIKDMLGETPRCPIILHFGALDKGIPLSDVDKIKKAHPQVPVYVYENADHGFSCDHRPQYNAAAAKLARERTLAFFKKHGG
jgi:carboxymethylenebutenolidase